MSKPTTQWLVEYHLGVLEEKETLLVENALLSSKPALNDYFAIKREFDDFNETMEPSRHIPSTIKQQIFKKNSRSSKISLTSSIHDFFPGLVLTTICLALLFLVGSKYLVPDREIAPSNLSSLKIDASNSNSVSLNIL